MRACANDLEKNGKLIRIKTELDPNLEIAEVHRRIYDNKGPALLFEKIKNSPFQGISNIYGTPERTDFIFRKTIERVKKVIELKADPSNLLKNPFRYLTAPFTALSALPKKAFFNQPVKYQQTSIDKLPQIISWPMDGGAFITMPQVCTLPPNTSSPMKTNIGMYRIQLSGNEYEMNKEIGLHYQLHRGIGVHHNQYNQSDKPFKASIFVGGPPSHAFSAIMPLPEGLSEMTFAGMLANKRFKYSIENNAVISSDADFVITGTVVKGKKKPEGPFGDHLGYYSLTHDFPYMIVDKVYHRKNPLWHFSVVGRPPQEDSSFGYLIHQLVEDLTSQEFPGVKEIHAVDAAGVHPLLLAIGSERYMPFREKKPEEILTQANRIIGSGQTSLAKYLIIANQENQLTTKNIDKFFEHVLERIDWTRDLHFHTNTTIDTLDYSGDGWNSGSKVVMACCGEKLRTLGTEIPRDLNLPMGFTKVSIPLPGVLAIQSPPHNNETAADIQSTLIEYLSTQPIDNFPLIIMVDDSSFTAQSINNFVWVTFTRSNPSKDIRGIEEFQKDKHWGCKGSLIIDARIKKHHAPELIPDKEVSKKVDKLFSKGGELYDVFPSQFRL